jgi:hypothetical protein
MRCCGRPVAWASIEKFTPLAQVAASASPLIGAGAGEASGEALGACMSNCGSVAPTQVPRFIRCLLHFLGTPPASCTAGAGPLRTTAPLAMLLGAATTQLPQPPTRDVAPGLDRHELCRNPGVVITRCTASPPHTPPQHGGSKSHLCQDLPGSGCGRAAGRSGCLQSLPTTHYLGPECCHTMLLCCPGGTPWFPVQQRQRHEQLQQQQQKQQQQQQQQQLNSNNPGRVLPWL